MASSQHLVLTADLVASRKVADREALQATLLKTLKTLNRRFRAIVGVPLSVSAGDEFQGLFRPDGEIIRLIDALQRELHPVRARVGIGIGGISTGLRRRSQEMDGEAFLLARQALDATRRQSPDAWLWFRTPDEEFDLAANAIALLLGLAKSRWKPLHWRRAALRDKGWSEQRIARREGVTHVAVSLSLRSAGYAAVRQAQSKHAGPVRHRHVQPQNGHRLIDVSQLVLAACRPPAEDLERQHTPG